MPETGPTGERSARTYGDNAIDAATELLRRAGLTALDEPWVLHDPHRESFTIDFRALAEGRPGLTPSEAAVVRLASSLAGSTLLDMRSIAHDLDYDHLLLAATAITHAAGYHHRTTIVQPDSTDSAIVRILQRPPIMNWDDNDTFG